MGFLLLGRHPREMRWDWGGGQTPPNAPTSPPRPTVLTKLSPPVQIPAPLPGSCWGKLSHGKAALRPNQTLQVFPGFTDAWHQGQVCSGWTEPLDGKVPLCLGGRQKPCAGLGCVPDLLCDFGQVLSSRLSFPVYTMKEQEPRSLKRFPVIKTRSLTLGRSPRWEAQESKISA